MVIENKNSLRTVRLNIKPMFPISMFVPITLLNCGLCTYIFQIATRVQTSKIVLYILPIDKWSDVQKSPFQLAKTQEMNRTDVSLTLQHGGI